MYLHIIFLSFISNVCTLDYSYIYNSINPTMHVALLDILPESSGSVLKKRCAKRQGTRLAGIEMSTPRRTTEGIMKILDTVCLLA